MKIVYVMCSNTVLNGTQNIKLKIFEKKGVRYYLYVFIMRFIYDNVDIYEE